MTWDFQQVFMMPAEQSLHVAAWNFQSRSTVSSEIETAKRNDSKEDQRLARDGFRKGRIACRSIKVVVRISMVVVGFGRPHHTYYRYSHTLQITLKPARPLNDMEWLSLKNVNTTNASIAQDARSWDGSGKIGSTLLYCTVLAVAYIACSNRGRSTDRRFLKSPKHSQMQ